jgi:hypothetical protein
MKGWWRDMETFRIRARIHRTLQIKWKCMKVARIPAKLKVSNMDQYCPKIAVFFMKLVIVISVCVSTSSFMIIA